MDGFIKIEVSPEGAKSLRKIAAEMGKSINDIKMANHELTNVVLSLKEDLGPKAEKIQKILNTVHKETEESKTSLMSLMRKLDDLANKIDSFCERANS